MKPKRILAVASMGGHMIQLMRLHPVLSRHHTHFVSSQRRPGMQHFTQVSDANRHEKLRLVWVFIQILCIVLRHRPDIVISTGAAPGFFAILCGKLLGARSIWLDSIANAEELSLSGAKAGKFADLWLTQWPEVSRPEGPHYGGRIL